jgi:excinuclease ABC subunit C
MTRFDFDAKRYPTQPGCYLMKDAGGQVIYVGKAKNLRRRLGSYFRSPGKGGPRRRDRKTARLVAHVADIEVILVNNEAESLILENNLIKEYKPRYNRKLIKEDTGYYYIAVTEEDLPRFVPYRKKRLNKRLKGQAIGRRFGPYTSFRFREVLLEYVCDNFQIRTCQPMPQRVCLRYHLDKCGGICEQKVSAEAYADAVGQAATFLSREHADLIRHMKSRMWEHVEQLEFEKAQRIRDQVEALENTLEKQVVERDVQHDQDIVYFGERKVLVTRAKRGMIQDLRLFDLDPANHYAEACEHFLLSHYAQDGPGELIVNRLRDPGRVEQALAAAYGHRVRITLPTQGVACELFKFCKLNYDYRVSHEE